MAKTVTISKAKVNKRGTRWAKISDKRGHLNGLVVFPKKSKKVIIYPKAFSMSKRDFAYVVKNNNLY